MRKTLKQIRTAMKSAPKTSTLSACSYLLAMLSEEEVGYLNVMHYVNTSNYKFSYMAMYEFDDDDNGILSCTLYDYDEWQKYENVFAETAPSLKSIEAWDAFEAEHKPKAVEVFEVPLDRGYSDTSKRTDTTLSSLDLEMATTEYLDEKHGCCKVYPWMIRGIVSADELGMEEEELEMELESMLN